ncbi:MAG TPA: hypothetical protein VIO38_06875 [Rariglobus sp.]
MRSIPPDEIILLKQGRIVARGDSKRTIHPATRARLCILPP